MNETKTSQIEMTEDEFVAQYPLLTNHLNPNASWTVNDNRGCLFETYGQELEFVRQQDPHTVWTLLDGDDVEILSGFHYVNRIGYLVSLVPVPEGTDILVCIPRKSDDLDESDHDSHDMESEGACIPIYRIVGVDGKTVYEGDMEGVALFAHNRTVNDLDLLSNIGFALEHVQLALEKAPDNVLLDRAQSALEGAHTTKLDSEEDEDDDEEE
jgi:hypothetical protein